MVMKRSEALSPNCGNYRKDFIATGRKERADDYVEEVMLELGSSILPVLEAYDCPTWTQVQIVEARSGRYLARYADDDEAASDEWWVSLDMIRMGTRKAISGDCQTILRKGVDVAVVCRNANGHSAVRDAKITGKERIPHSATEACSCTFSLQYHHSQQPAHENWEDRLSDRCLEAGRPRVVTISALRILQRPSQVPFYNILKAHYFRVWSVVVDTWYQDALFLRETVLSLGVTNQGLEIQSVEFSEQKHTLDARSDRDDPKKNRRLSKPAAPDVRVAAEQEKPDVDETRKKRRLSKPIATNLTDSEDAKEEVEKEEKEKAKGEDEAAPAPAKPAKSDSETMSPSDPEVEKLLDEVLIALADSE